MKGGKEEEKSSEKGKNELENKKQKPSFREGIQGIARHLRPYSSQVVLLVILGLVSAAANGFVPYITGRFLDTLISVAGGEIETLAGIPFWAVMLALWAAVQIVANGVDWVSDRIRRSLSIKMRFGIEILGFTHLLRLPLGYHANARMGGEIEKINTAGWRVTAIMRDIVNVAPQFLSVLIGIILAFSINATLAMVLAAGVLAYVILLIPMLLPIAGADEVAHKAWNDSWNDMTESAHQVTSVKQAAAEEYQAFKMRDAFYGKVYALWMRLEYTWSNMGAFQRGIVFLTQLAVFILSVGFVANGAITIGELVALNGYAAMFFGPFVSLGYSWQTIQNGLTSAALLERMLTLEEEDYHPANAHAPAQGAGKVDFENVVFNYGEGKGGVLDHMTFSTRSGQSVALVGESGAGKSTTLALLSGYYFPNQGSVRVGGVDTRAWDLIELRKRIAVVPQEVALFNDTIRANIRYGAFDATNEQVEAAARQAHIHEFITTLPKGYETLVGERGVKLSVGQKQRVAIARAILRNPEILILDEPTSALDSQTERLITESLEKLMRGRTTFIIAHRLSTVRKADTILVMEKGKIVEQGSHAELMQVPDGSYRRLYELQIGLHG